jgi:GH24 family phage-related lysozyme (muramidase)
MDGVSDPSSRRAGRSPARNHLPKITVKKPLQDSLGDVLVPVKFNWGISHFSPLRVLNTQNLKNSLMAHLCDSGLISQKAEGQDKVALILSQHSGLLFEG